MVRHEVASLECARIGGGSGVGLRRIVFELIQREALEFGYEFVKLA